MDKVRLGILGCALVAEKHAIAAFKMTPNVELVSIASRDPEKAQAWADKHGLTSVESYETLLESDDIDAVYIPLPIGLHEEWVLKAADHGKHVLCEKSLTTSYDSAKRMIEHCRKRRVVLYENFMCDFHPQHAHVQKLIQGKKLGEPFTFQAYFGFPPLDKKGFRYNKKLGGGSLNDAGAYTLFMARKYFGEPIAVTATLNTDSESEVDLQGSAYLEFKNNKTGLLGFGFDNLYQNNYSIWGSRGLVRVLRAYGIPADLKPPVELVTNENMTETLASLDIPAANQFAFIFQDFADTVLTKDDSRRESAYSKALAQARVMEATRISANEHRRVSLEEI